MSKRIAAKGITGQHVEDLTIEVENLKHEVRVLRDVLDEIREDLQWLVQNLPIADLRLSLLMSLPLDPATDDFASSSERSVMRAQCGNRQ